MSENEAYQFSAGARSQFGDLGVNYGFFYGRDFVRSPVAGFTQGGNLTYDVTNVGFTMDNIQSPAEMTLTQTSGADYRRVASFGRLNWTATSTSTIDVKQGARIDLTRTINNLRYPTIVQAGLAYDVQERTNSRTAGEGLRYTFGSGPDGVFGNADDVALPLERFVDERLVAAGGWNMRGFPTIDPGEFIDLARLADYVADHPEAATLDRVNDVTSYYGTQKEFREEIDAAYLMATVRLGRFTLVPGLRWERTDDRGSGFGRRTQPTPAGLTLEEQAAFVKAQYFPLSRRKSYDGLYPNLQARFNVNENFLLRTAYTETIGRPNFGSLLPGDTVNDTNMTISRTNPALEPFTARNYDLSAEYYFGRNAGSLTAAVFRKEISNYFQSVQFILPGGADNGYDGQYEGYTVTESRNIAGETRTEGFEFGYQQNLGFLPGLLRYLGASASYTHVRATPPPGTRAATGIYPDVWNFGITYNDRRLRVDLKYNLRESWLTSVSNNNGERSYYLDNDRLDLSINYRFRPQYTVYFDWRNCLNERDTRLVEGRYSFWQQAGMSINAGIRADF